MSLDAALRALGEVPWNDLLERLSEARCVLGLDPERDSYPFPGQPERWVVYTLDDHDQATPVGDGGSPGTAMISALLTLSGLDDETFAVGADPQTLTTAGWHELNAAHARMAAFLEANKPFAGDAA